MRRLDSLLLAGVGILAIHQIAYALAPLVASSSVVGHGHLELAWTIGSLAAVAGLASAVTRSLKRRQHQPMPIGTLVALLAGGYAGLELAERLIEGIAPTALLTEAVFWIGLAAVVPAALVLRASVRTVADLVLQFAERAESLPVTDRVTGPLPFSQTSRTPIPLPVRSRSCSRRGPPFVR